MTKVLFDRSRVYTIESKYVQFHIGSFPANHPLPFKDTPESQVVCVIPDSDEEAEHDHGATADELISALRGLQLILERNKKRLPMKISTSTYVFVKKQCMM